MLFCVRLLLGLMRPLQGKAVGSACLHLSGQLTPLSRHSPRISLLQHAFHNHLEVKVEHGLQNVIPSR